MVQDYPTIKADFAVWSPTDAKIAYIFNHDVYVRDMATSNIESVTFNGGEIILNDTLDNFPNSVTPNLPSNLMYSTITRRYLVVSIFNSDIIYTSQRVSGSI